MKKHNFSAGPCLLPQEVFQKASAAVVDYENSGLSILEISHRSEAFTTIMQNAQNLAKELMNLNNEFEVLFLQGGASLQFAMIPFNLMHHQNGKAVYLNTGIWSQKAITEAQKLGHVEEIKSEDYRGIPKNYTVSPKANYFHCTSNNTIYGTQIKEFPKVQIPLVCDMSSDILSHTIDYNQFDLIYAGAQKNIGTAGATLVAVKKSILGKTERNIVSYLDYQKHIEKKGIYNTSPVFSVYVAMLNLQWLKNQGGVAAIETINQQKARLIYQEIDRNPLFYGYANPKDRSKMNATFFLKDEKLTTKFLNLCLEADIVGVKGHRTVGGFRASMYNAMPVESVKILVAVMQELEKQA